MGYRLGIKLGLHPVCRIRASAPKGEFFKAVDLVPTDLPSRLNWQQSGILFGRWFYPIGGGVPDWHSNPLTGAKVVAADRDWWLIPDFDPNVGDIKAIWEASRFDWVLSFAQQARVCDGNAETLGRLNHWLKDWCQQNPPYKGPNWKCGQEASIRVIHLAVGSLILGRALEPEQSLLELVRIHLQRIEPTLNYAMAQDNNHGTSEAAALYIGGSWLHSQGLMEGEYWFQLGRKWLENRAAQLIEEDGSFSQYSLNYHRLMLDTFCIVEIWRRVFDLMQFSLCWSERSRAATHWLHSMVCEKTGDAPNLGANDGARLLQLTNSDYRDFRPTVQMAMVLFANTRAYSGEGSWNLPLSWLGVELPNTTAPTPGSRLFNDGGFAILRRSGAMVMLRYPRFRFRPSQADALHVDLWLDGRNLLRDSGTFSYNTDTRWLNYFPGTVSHNTVQFDDRDQMPRISRFLFGDWLKTSYFEPICERGNTTTFAVSYRDRQKAGHWREVSLADNGLRVIDKIEGFVNKAILRWKLEPGHWRIEGHRIFNGEHTLILEASMPITRLELVAGYESRYYFDKEKLQVLEVEVHQPGSLTTEYQWTL
ncbi:heparinase II/III family protein [Microbulbifer epialgicus]|uniref:Heparinase II/III family protein n=1 Tax=Microbulbifer epialgicus TaxID=393907 RepID=A0ABV4P2S0_9GAMM